MPQSRTHGALLSAVHDGADCPSMPLGMMHAVASLLRACKTGICTVGRAHWAGINPCGSQRKASWVSIWSGPWGTPPAWPAKGAASQEGRRRCPLHTQPRVLPASTIRGRPCVACTCTCVPPKSPHAHANMQTRSCHARAPKARAANLVCPLGARLLDCAVVSAHSPAPMAAAAAAVLEGTPLPSPAAGPEHRRRRCAPPHACTSLRYCPRATATPQTSGPRHSGAVHLCAPSARLPPPPRAAAAAAACAARAGAARVGMPGTCRAASANPGGGSGRSGGAWSTPAQRRAVARRADWWEQGQSRCRECKQEPRQERGLASAQLGPTAGQRVGRGRIEGKPRQDRGLAARPPAFLQAGPDFKLPLRAALASLQGAAAPHSGWSAIPLAPSRELRPYTLSETRPWMFPKPSLTHPTAAPPRT